jgi:hypothetical protein
MSTVACIWLNWGSLVRFEQPPQMTRAELEEALRGGNGEKIRDALISASCSEKGEWVQSWCVRLSNHSDPTARYGAAVVLGNNAVVHFREIDLLKSLEAVEKLSADPEERVRVAATDSLGDVLHAIKLKGTS